MFHRIMAKMENMQRHHRMFFASLLALGSLFLIALAHSLTHFAPALLPLYIIPIWIAVHLDGVRSGSITAVSSAIVLALAESQWDRAMGLTPGLVFGSVASVGLVMLLMAWVEESLVRTRRMALEDPLTGLMNRRAFFENAEKLVRSEQEVPMIVVAIDCDNFKELNDTFGHSAGDKVLRSLASVLEAHTRDSDLVARIGGDEFVLVLNDVNLREARRIVARIEREFETLVQDSGYSCTITSGLAEPDLGSKSLDSLLRVADQAMYVGKESKRRAYLN